MRKFFFLFIFIAVLATSGCSTKSSYMAMPGVPHIETAATYSIGDVKDMSSFKFKPDDKDSFDLAEAMRAALRSELAKKGNLGDPGKYTLDVNILRYEPGNAGLRWLVPGAGATKLSIDASVKNSEGKVLAKIPVERSIAAGGGYTIGAWKYVFEEVAQELVTVLNDTSKRKPPQ